MVRIARAVVIRLVAAHTSVRSVVIVSVVAGSAIVGNSCVCPVQSIIIVVNRERSRLPTGGGRVAHGAIRRDIQRNVIGVGCPIEIRSVTTRAGIRRIVEVPSYMTKGTVVGDGYMRSRERINLVMVISRGRPSCFRVAKGTICREL